MVRVTVHNVTMLIRGPSGVAGWGSPGAARLLYWVRVRGRPVPAATAAHDMRLISDHEMAAELGLPIITKAEREYSSGVAPGPSRLKVYFMTKNASYPKRKSAAL